MIKRFLKYMLMLAVVITALLALSITASAIGEGDSPIRYCENCDDMVPFCSDCGEVCLACSPGCLESNCYLCEDCWVPCSECDYNCALCNYGCTDCEICEECYEDRHCQTCGACLYCHDSPCENDDCTLFCEDCAEDDEICDECGLCSSCLTDYPQTTWCPGCNTCPGCLDEFLCPDCGECSRCTDYSCKECAGCSGCRAICQYCEEICSECGELCSYCEEVCIDCAELWCVDCGTCGDCAEICEDCGAICEDCADAWCESCELCSDCVDLCEDCEEICEDCADEWCEECYRCIDCFEVWCEECETCGDCVELCSDCEEICVDCAKTWCEDCGTCGDCVDMCPDCGAICSDCAKLICVDCGACGDCVDLCADCKDICEDCSGGWCPECKKCDICVEPCMVCKKTCTDCCDCEEPENQGHKHSLNRVKPVEPTCSQPGNILYYECTDCGKWFEDSAAQNEITDKNSVILTVNHSLGVLIPQVDPVHTVNKLKDGMKAHYVCSNCKTYFTAQKRETTKESLAIPAPEHTYIANAYKGKDGHAAGCACGAMEAVQPHVPGPTATETTDQTCTVCGYVIQVSLNHKHDLEKVPAKEPTCTETGNEEYYTCDCGKIFADEAGKKEITVVGTITIPPTHNYGELIEQVFPSHGDSGDTDGVLAHYHCPDCGQDFTPNKVPVSKEDLIIPAGDHKFTDDNHDGICDNCKKAEDAAIEKIECLMPTEPGDSGAGNTPGGNGNRGGIPWWIVLLLALLMVAGGVLVAIILVKKQEEKAKPEAPAEEQ